jgi:hypothetical protein
MHGALRWAQPIMVICFCIIPKPTSFAPPLFLHVFCATWVLWQFKLFLVTEQSARESSVLSTDISYTIDLRLYKLLL